MNGHLAKETEMMERIRKIFVEREEEYQKAGWRHDPFPEELEEEDEEEEKDWHYHSMEERLNEVGMSMRDFF